LLSITRYIAACEDKMPGKRSSRKKVEQFFCPYCERRLWRLGGSKHHLFLGSISKTQQDLQTPSNLPRKRSEKNADIDPNQWIEEFFCGEHGRLWMLVCRTTHDRLTAVPASKTDWQRSTGTPSMDFTNPSVSEFSIRMSRRADIRLKRRND
jgi:hypothetical protein